jgi:hypothetical protein
MSRPLCAATAQVGGEASRSDIAPPVDLKPPCSFERDRPRFIQVFDCRGGGCDRPRVGEAVGMHVGNILAEQGKRHSIADGVLEPHVVLYEPRLDPIYRALIVRVVVTGAIRRPQGAYENVVRRNGKRVLRLDLPVPLGGVAQGIAGEVVVGLAIRRRGRC